MNRQQFEARYGPAWRSFEAALAALKKVKAGRASPPVVPGVAAGTLVADAANPASPASPATPGDTVRDFPETYRQVCHHLALARRRCYGADLEERLSDLALRGHRQLYGRGEVERPSWVERAAAFPRQVRREARLVGLALLLFAVPLAVMDVAVRQRPDLAYSLISAEKVEEAGEQFGPERATWRARQFHDDLTMFGFYIYNNVRLAFRTFAGGALLGVGAGLVLALNGLHGGAVAGYVGAAGYGGPFYSFVIGHGAFELPAIVLAGAAGLRIGLALLSPGPRSRRRALLETARESVVILYGAAAMLVVAAFLEAFWSSSSVVPAGVKLGVGGVLWACVLAYFAIAGREHGG